MIISVIKISRIITPACFCLLFTNLNAQQKAINAFHYASELVIDSKGNLYVSGKTNKIIKITPDRIAWHFAGHLQDNSKSNERNGSETSFAGITGLAIDNADNIYVADYNTIRKVTPEAVITTIYGNPKKAVVRDGDRKEALFYRTGAITIDKQGTLYVVDKVFDSLQKRNFAIIRKIAPSGYVQTLKKPDGSVYRAHYIEGLVCNNEGNLYVARVGWSTCIDKVTPAGAITTIVGVYDENIKNRASFLEGDIKTARVIKPTGLAFNEKEELVFSDHWIGRILKISGNKVIVIAGGGGKSAEGTSFIDGGNGKGYADGKAKLALFESPHAIAFDRKGNLFIADVSLNSSIRKLSPDGIVTTFCKQAYNPVTKQYEENLQREPVKIAPESMVADKKNKEATEYNSRIKKEVADITEKAKNYADSIMRMSPKNSNPYADKSFANRNLPVADSVKIKTLPAKALSLSELRIFLKDLHTQLAKKFLADQVASAAAIVKKLDNDPKKVEAAAMIGWQNGATEESLLLIVAAAANADADAMTLTNTGAMLDMAGLSEKAIPVLRTITTLDPRNAIALNNMGQAYTALGMQDSALYYFSRCLSLSPQHPEANNTAGVIEFKRGNKHKALPYFENSIRGSFNLCAYNGIIAIKKDYKINKLIKPKVKVPGYFNQFKYILPPQCTNVDMAEKTRKEYQVFLQTIHWQKEQYAKLQKQAAAQFSATGLAQTQNKMAKGKTSFKPFLSLAYVMGLELNAEYQEEKLELNNTFDKQYQEQYADLEKQYETDYAKMMKDFRDSEKGECCREGNTSCCAADKEVCNAGTALRNKYLPRFAQLTEDWQTRHLLVEKKYFDDLIYWNYLASFDDNDFRSRFYYWVNHYLGELGRLCKTKILEPCHPKEFQEPEKPAQTELKQFDCPVDLTIPFLVGKISMNCEKLSFKAGELVVFKYEKQFTGSRQSTMSIGAGVGIDASYKAGPFKAGSEAGLDMSVYLSFDNAGNCTDGGMVYSVYAGGALDFAAGERIKLKKDVASVSEKIGWRFGINSGVSFITPTK
jgi:tetratricopeptide (TPR) repeat protein